MKLNRNVISMRKLADEDNVRSQISARERILSVWEITVEIWGIATKGMIHAESRLQRNVVSLVRTSN